MVPRTWTRSSVAFLLVAGICSAGERPHEALRNLKPMAAGSTDTRYFEVFVSDEPIGYSTTTLTPRQSPAVPGQTTGDPVPNPVTPAFEYKNVAVTFLANGVKIITETTAHLGPAFEPLLVDITRTHDFGEDHKKFIKESARIGPEEVKLTRVKDGKETKRNVPRPGGVLAYALDALIPRLDLETHSVFDVWEFNAQEGRSGILMLKAVSEPGGTIRVTGQRADYFDGPYFILNAEGLLLEWSDPANKMKYRQVKTEQFDALVKRWNP